MPSSFSEALKIIFERGTLALLQTFSAMTDKQFCRSVMYLPRPPESTNMVFSVMLVRMPSRSCDSTLPLILETSSVCSAMIRDCGSVSAQIVDSFFEGVTLPCHALPKEKANPISTAKTVAQTYFLRRQKHGAGSSISDTSSGASIAANAFFADSFVASMTSNSSQMRRAVATSPCSNLIRANKSVPEGVFNVSGADTRSCSASAYLPCVANAYARNMATSAVMVTIRQQVRRPQNQCVLSVHQP